jgi:hypothetical protein
MLQICAEFVNASPIPCRYANMQSLQRAAQSNLEPSEQETETMTTPLTMTVAAAALTAAAAAAAMHASTISVIAAVVALSCSMVAIGFYCLNADTIDATD